MAKALKTGRYLCADFSLRDIRAAPDTEFPCCHLRGRIDWYYDDGTGVTIGVPDVVIKAAPEGMEFHGVPISQKTATLLALIDKIIAGDMSIFDVGKGGIEYARQYLTRKYGPIPPWPNMTGGG